MGVNLNGTQEPKGFGEVFSHGFPITEKENNEIEVPYYESDDDISEDGTASEYQGETESDYASSDDNVVCHREVTRLNRNKSIYKTILCIEDDFIPE